MIFKSDKKSLISSYDLQSVFYKELHFAKTILIYEKTICKPSSFILKPAPTWKSGHIIKVLFQEFQILTDS